MNSLGNQREVTPMTQLRCYLGKHKWESQEDSWGEKHWVCAYCDKQHTHPPGKYVPPVPPSGS